MKVRVIPIGGSVVIDGKRGRPRRACRNRLMGTAIHLCWEMDAVPMGGGRLSELIGDIDCDCIVLIEDDGRPPKRLGVVTIGCGDYLIDEGCGRFGKCQINRGTTDCGWNPKWIVIDRCRWLLPRV